MGNNAIIVILALQATKKVSHWIFHLGAFGLIPLGMLDASVDSAARQHGRAHHCVGRQAAGLVDLLRANRHCRIGARKFFNLSAGAQGREGDAGEEIVAQEHGESDGDF